MYLLYSFLFEQEETEGTEEKIVYGLEEIFQVQAKELCSLCFLLFKKQDV